MICNATLVSCTTPRVSDGRGGSAVGGGMTTPVTSRVNVQQSRRSRFAANADTAANAVAVLFAPDGFVTEPDGLVTYRVDGEISDRTLQVISVEPWSHGLQSHVQVQLRIPG